MCISFHLSVTSLNRLHLHYYVFFCYIYASRPQYYGVSEPLKQSQKHAQCMQMVMFRALSDVFIWTIVWTEIAFVLKRRLKMRRQ